MMLSASANLGCRAWIQGNTVRFLTANVFNDLKTSKIAKLKKNNELIII